MDGHSPQGAEPAGAVTAGLGPRHEAAERVFKLNIVMTAITILAIVSSLM